LLQSRAEINPMKTINAGATLLGLCFYLLIGFVAAKADAGESGANASNRVSGGMTWKGKDATARGCHLTE